MKLRASLNCAAILTIAGIACATAAGCSGQSTADVLPPLPSGATEPFDHFLVDEFMRIDFALNELTHTCMKRDGFRETKQAIPMLKKGHDRTPLVRAPLRPRTEVQARKYGFGEPIPAQERVEFYSDPTAARAYDKCEAAAPTVLGDGPKIQKALHLYGELRNELIDDVAAKTAAAVAKHREALTKCFQRKGFRLKTGQYIDPKKWSKQFDIPFGRHQVHKDPKALTDAKTGITTLPPVPRKEYIPSKPEINLAVAFVHCGKRTGLFARIDKAWKSIQQQIVESHAKDFAELNPEIEALAKKATKILRK